MRNLKSKEKYVVILTNIHNNKYTYIKSDFSKKHTKTIITCNIHGDFSQTLYNHLKGQGCPKCAGNLKRTTNDVINSFNKIHKNKYDYSKFIYTGAKNKGIIICKLHGEFIQKSNNHMNGQGCPDCGIIVQSNKNRNSIAEFIEKSHLKHDNKYDYSKFMFTDNKKGIIICKAHGEFIQSVKEHLSGKGCYECRKEYKLENKKKKFIEKANIKHNNKYDYSQVTYLGSKVKVDIICKAHGIFTQVPSNHLSGQGCPVCASIRRSSINISEGEVELYEYIKTLTNEQIIRNDRIILDPYELDIYIPSLNLAFEYNGDYWHQEGLYKPVGYHQDKTDKCKIQGIMLYHIWESEWKNTSNKVRKNIKEIICQY